MAEEIALVAGVIVAWLGSTLGSLSTAIIRNLFGLSLMGVAVLSGAFSILLLAFRWKNFAQYAYMGLVIAAIFAVIGVLVLGLFK